MDSLLIFFLAVKLFPENEKTGWLFFFPENQKENINKETDC